ncbi:hypothetical protein [Spiroplasma endosymbiont of Dactylopius coccus]|nr:hypothetical protein [Spiroplasma ixodetis]
MPNNYSLIVKPLLQEEDIINSNISFFKTLQVESSTTMISIIPSIKISILTDHEIKTGDCQKSGIN